MWDEWMSSFTRDVRERVGHCSASSRGRPTVRTEVIRQPGTGHSPPSFLLFFSFLLIFCILSQSRHHSCMVDIIFNSSFLGDMGDHSKSKWHFLHVFLSAFHSVVDYPTNRSL